MFKFKAAACVLAAVALTTAPVHSASAHYYRHGGGIFWGIGALGAAVIGTAAAIATAPFVALAPRPYYGAPPPIMLLRPPTIPHLAPTTRRPPIMHRRDIMPRPDITARAEFFAGLCYKANAREVVWTGTTQL